MNDRAKRGDYRAPLHVLVAAVTHAERGTVFPRVVDLATEIGCRPSNVSMALTRLENSGIIKRVSRQGDRLRLLVVSTGALTGDPGDGE